MDEAPLHPHNVARSTFIEIDGVVQPAPAPRFSRTPGAVSAPPAKAGAHTLEALADWGVIDVERLLDAGVIGQAARPVYRGSAAPGGSHLIAVTGSQLVRLATRSAGESPVTSSRRCAAGTKRSATI